MTGIDYGLGQTNIDTTTGIRYGIIPLADVNMDCVDDFEGHYRIGCRNCGAEFDDNVDLDELEACPGCGHTERDPSDWYSEDPISRTYNGDGYALEINGQNDIWIFKSPYTTRAGFCSPCAPGAVYLTSDGETQAYALGPDWFADDTPMPYIVTPYTEDATPNRV